MPWWIVESGMVFNLYTLDPRTHRAVKTPIFLFWRPSKRADGSNVPLSGQSLGALFWCTPAAAEQSKGTPPADPRNSLPVLSITEYRTGSKTPVLQAAAADEARCFALVAGDVAFNLEAESGSMRSMWLEGLGALMARKYV
jgi:hypothetical protein